MRKLIILGVIVLALSSFILYFRWSSSIHQPLNFSHAQHVKANSECSTCHSSVDDLPATSICKNCHSGETFPSQTQWVRVYRVAPDIIFSHTNHKESCETCHVQMVSGARWIHEYRFPMDFCMKCHAEKRAPNQCGTCHRNR